MSVHYFPHAKVLRVANVLLSRSDTSYLIKNARASHDTSPDTLLGQVNRAVQAHLHR